MEKNEELPPDIKFTNNYSLFLGLDISTTTTGCCVLYPDGRIERLEAVELSNLVKEPNLWKKADEMEVWFKTLERDIFIKPGNPKIKKVFVEENMKSFQAGKSSANVLFTLAKFNGIVSYLAQKVFSGSEVIDINVSSARKTLGISIKKNVSLSAKEQTFKTITEGVLKDFDFPKHVAPTGKFKGATVYDGCCKDMVDSYVLCRAGQLLHGIK